MPGAILGAVASTVVGSMLSDDNGAEAANNSAADANRLQAEIARDQWNRYKQIYAPLEGEVIGLAKDAGSRAEYEQAAGDAAATVSQQFGLARDRLSRAPGMDPSAPSFTKGMMDLDLAQAASGATQQNVARRAIKDSAWNKKVSALGLGKGLDTTAASGLASAASNNMRLASIGMDQANMQARAAGNVIDRTFNSPTMQGWLGNVGTATRYGTNVGSQQTRMLAEQDAGLI
jgi:hypothetical protein